MADTTHEQEAVRNGAAAALTQVLEVHTDHIPAVLSTLLDLYEEKLYVSPCLNFLFYSTADIYLH